MPLAEIEGTLAASLKRGERFSITATQLTVDENFDSETDTYVIAAVPVRGSLRLNGKLLVLGSEFTQAVYDVGPFEYLHNGTSTTSDSFQVLIRRRTTISTPSGDSIVIEDTAASTVAVTIATDNYGWLWTVKPSVFPPMLPAYTSAKWYLEDATTQWSTSHWGTSTITEITDSGDAAFIATLIAKDEYRFIEDTANSPLALIHGLSAQDMAARLKIELNKTANADLREVVNVHGADIELRAPVWNSLDEAQQTRWVKIRNTINVVPTRRIEITNSDWQGAINLTKGSWN